MELDLLGFDDGAKDALDGRCVLIFAKGGAAFR
jgi:hypothetical protein